MNDSERESLEKTGVSVDRKWMTDFSRDFFLSFIFLWKLVSLEEKFTARSSLAGFSFNW